MGNENQGGGQQSADVQNQNASNTENTGAEKEVAQGNGNQEENTGADTTNSGAGEENRGDEDIDREGEEGNDE